MPERWLEVSIRASAEAAEALTAVFERAGHGGVVIEPEVVPGIEVDEVHPAPGGFSRLRTYIPDGNELPARRDALAQAVGILRAFDLAPMDELEFRWIKEEDWANAWKQHYHVQRIGRHWVVKPRWQQYVTRGSDRVLELDPGMAFGTGLHPTTQMALECLEMLHDAGEIAGQDVLDLGTGSGILAIGAARLGAASVLALDVEEVAVTAAGANVATNGVSGVVDVRQASLGPAIDGVVPVPGLDYAGAFDGILANIVARVLAERAPAMARAARAGAWLVAGGIIGDLEIEAARGLTGAGFTVEQRIQRGDWITLVCRRDASNVLRR